jgi:hypothetical protein
MTAHNQWLSKTRSIPYWTTSVFSSTVTNADESLLTHWTSLWKPLLSVWVWVFCYDRRSLGQSVRGLRPDFCYCQKVAGLLMWGALSDERAGLSFEIAAGPCQCSHSWLRVPWDSWPYFTVSNSRLPFSSPPTTSRATVEVFDPASTRGNP